MNRVVLDYLWRKKWAYAGSLAILALNWGIAVQSSTGHGLTAYVFYLFLLSAVLSVNADLQLAMRSALFVLPMSRTSRGSGLWFLNVMVPALLGLCAKGVAGGVAWLLPSTAAVDWAWLVFSTLFDLAFIGAFFSPWILSLNPTRGLGRAQPMWLIVAGFAGVGVMGRYVPAGWDQLNAWNGLALLAGLGLTAAGYRQSSRLGVMWGARSYREVASSAPRASSTRNATPTRRPAGSRLSSVRRILWTQFRDAVVSAILLLVACGIFEAVVSRQWHIVRILSRLAPFVDLGRDPFQPFLLIGFLTVASVTTRALQIGIRALRVLPLATWELNALLIARLAVTWFGYWLVLAAADLVLGGRSPTLSGVEVFAGLFGVTCLANAAALRWQSPASWMVGFALAAFTIGFGAYFAGRLMEVRLHMEGWILHPAAIAGMACLIAAACWNHRLLTRSRVIYKRTTLFPESA
jgi:hypothetical protein